MLAHEAGSTPQQIAGQVSGANRTRRAAERLAAKQRNARYEIPGSPGHPRICICDSCENRRDRHIQYGPYSLLKLSTGGWFIRRQDPDHNRTVAFVESPSQWDHFIAALKDGKDEVAAVHAIDEVPA